MFLCVLLLLKGLLSDPFANPQTLVSFDFYNSPSVELLKWNHAQFTCTLESFPSASQQKEIPFTLEETSNLEKLPCLLLPT
jgi:hypothetical protein